MLNCENSLLNSPTCICFVVGDRRKYPNISLVLLVALLAKQPFSGSWKYDANVLGVNFRVNKGSQLGSANALTLA